MLAEPFAFRFDVPLQLADALVPLLVALVIAAGCVGAGRLARGGTRNLPLDFVIGYPLLGAACFLVGLVKVNVWTMGPVVLALGVLSVRGAGGTPARQPARTPALRSLSILFVIVVLLCGWIMAPATEHLIVPHTWVLEGRAVSLPLLAQSHRPLGIESAAMPALALLGPSGGGVSSHFLNWFAAIAATWLIARRTQSWLLTAAIVTTPALALHLADWPLLGIFVATLDDEEPSAATAAGLLTSYTFLPFAALVWLVRRKRPRWILLAGLLFYLRAVPVIATGERELALADFVFDPRWMHEALGASVVALPAFASGAVAAGSAVIAIALFFLGPSARILVPYLAIASMNADMKKRWLAVVMIVAVALQTLVVISFTGRAPRPGNPAIAWLNQTLPKDARTLIVGTSETYWLTRRARGGDAPRLSRYLEVPTSEALRARLEEDGITHVALIAPRRNEERQMTLSPAARRMLAVTLDRYAAGVTSRDDVTLFELR